MIGVGAIACSFLDVDFLALLMIATSNLSGFNDFILKQFIYKFSHSTNSN